MTLRTCLLLVGLGLLWALGVINCRLNVNFQQASEDRRLSVPPVAGSGLEVRTAFGGISVVADSGVTNVEIIAKINAGGETLEEAKTNLSRVLVKTERRSEQVLAIWMEAPKLSRFGAGCSFEVRVPEAKGIKARTSNGAIHLQGLGGAVDAETSFGSVTVRKQRGPVTLRSSNGAISAEQIAGSVKANTSFGHITARDVEGKVDATTSNGGIEVVKAGDAVQATTAFGTVTIRDVAGKTAVRNSNGAIKIEKIRGDVTASTSFGSVEAREVTGAADLSSLNGTLTYAPAKGNENTFQLTATFGAVTVYLPSSAKGTIKAATSFGNIQVDGPRKPISVTGEKEQKQIVLTDSGGVSEIRTSNGAIRVHLE
ncbi:MAG: DUF4097 family beta strand repeat-containing protein [Verrucomicrobiota bacterium]